MVRFCIFLLCDHKQLTSFAATGTSGSFVAERIQLNTNATQVVVGNGFIADALIYVRFPQGEFSRLTQSYNRTC